VFCGLCYKCCVVSVICMCGCLSVLFFFVIIYHQEEKRRVELVHCFNVAYPYHGGMAEIARGINLYASFTTFLQVAKKCLLH
jgi:hypothetical protein